MKAADFYNSREIVDSFGKSKSFETNRKIKTVIPSWPQYSEEFSEYHCAWMIYLMSRTGDTTTSQAVYNAVMAGKRLKSGNENFIIWLGNLLTNPEACKQITSIWIFQGENFVQVNRGNDILIFQGDTQVKKVSSATCLSGAFLYDFAKRLNIKNNLIADTSPVFEYDGNESEDENLNEYR